jgi:hypothetical protein
MATDGIQAQSASGAIRLTITPVSDFYDKDDPRYSSEAFELQQALVRELPDELEVRAEPGEKGGLADLIVNIATGGAISGLVEVFKAWLGARPVHRRIDLEFEVVEDEGKRTGKLIIDASNVDSKQLAAIAGEAFKSRG